MLKANPFENPFTLSNNDQRQLNDFFDDDDDDDGAAYEEVVAHDDVDHDDRHASHGTAASYDGDDAEHGGGGNAMDGHGSYHQQQQQQQQQQHGHNGEHYEDVNDDDDQGAVVPRHRRRRRPPKDNDNNQTLGNLMPNMFSTSESNSLNTIWLAVLVSLLFFLGAYYGLSKEHNGKLKALDAADRQDQLVGSPLPLPNDDDDDDDDAAQDVVPVADGVDNGAYKLFASNEGEEEEGPGLLFDQTTESVKKAPVFTVGSLSSSLNFDPFNLQQHPPTKIKEGNDWLGAPFVVSPPQLPSAPNSAANDDTASGNDDTTGSRMGYFQNPTIADGTIVFSTEGDLYLTRLPDGTNDDNANINDPDYPMPAMKLTTTVGNALHPKLNPKHPHLLAYSATYSGVREVYLTDLRPSRPSSDGRRAGTPGTPGGPALRLTYTPGGIRSVAGWDADGSSILYAASSMDAKSLPAVRLFRLRLSWGSEGEGEGSDSDVEKAKGAGVNPEMAVKKGEENEAAKGKEKRANEKAAANANKNKGVGKKGAGTKKNQKKTGAGAKKNQKEFNSYEDDDDDDDMIADAQTYVEQIAAPDKPAKEVSESPNNGSNGSNGSDNKHPKNAKKENNNEKIDKDHQRMLERQERQRRHLAELSARSTARQRREKESSSVHSIVEPIPLAQATEGVDSAGCVYFTRYKQSSSTKRYVGGTAESLWAYCAGRFDDVAVPLTKDYNGTSKSPSVYAFEGVGDVLLFMSDRSPVGNEDSEEDDIEWVASSMELWAVALPAQSTSSESGLVLGKPTRLTNVACQNNGIDLSEFAVDPSSGAVILRIGADLHYLSPEIILVKLDPSKDNSMETMNDPLPIAVYSDFSSMQERILPLQIPQHIKTIDAYKTHYGTVSALLTARGQTFVAPVIADIAGLPEGQYGGGGRNMPGRRYKVAPGTGGGGMVRILSAKHVPQPAVTSAPIDSGERLSLILATDPLTPTSEHAFYLVRSDAMASPAFGFAALYEYGDIVEGTGLPAPFVGGHLSALGGSTKDGGLGSVYADSIKVSPCGRRFTFTDTDGRIVVITIPPTSSVNETSVNGHRNLQEIDLVVLSSENEVGQPLVGDSETELVWSPGGRYLAIVHSARNQFRVISIADLGEPKEGEIKVGRIVQATSDRFNSFSPVWGHASKDLLVELYASALDPAKSSTGEASAIIFLSDRDVKLAGSTSPWGTRAPSPSFDGKSCVHILPLQSPQDALDLNSINQYITAPYGGGGAREVSMKGIKELTILLETIKQLQGAGLTVVADDQNAASGNTDAVQKNETEKSAEESNSTATDDPSVYPYATDSEISFGKENDQQFTFSRSSYRVDHIPAGDYVEIVAQLADDPSILLLSKAPLGFSLSLFAIVDWPSDSTEEVPAPAEQILQYVEMSTDGQFFITIVSNKVKVTPKTVKDAVAYFSDAKLEKHVADAGGLHLSIWPQAEYRQLYGDAWRMLRDYFYDRGLHSVNWEEVFDRYSSLVDRCSKREELDDVLRQMIGELSALHSFVYGGEYNVPHHGDATLGAVNDVATLGAVLQRSVEKRGYVVIDVPARDPDFHMIDGTPMYSPLSDQVLRLSGQSGLKPGDVIVGLNGENVIDVPDIHMLLRNMAGESVRLDVLRVKSTSRQSELRKLQRRLLQQNNNESADTENEGLIPEPLIVVPMTSGEGGDLSYAAWEWNTRERVKSLADSSGFTCGYAHMRSMSGAPAMDSFVRGFYPDYDKNGLIIDVRDNRGGNIDSWLLDILQRKAWMYWESRSSNITTGGLGWDNQFAFRGHLVVLINEHTSSDGEGFARGVHELGLGKLVGTRTWGGGIWLSSDNHLVDGGIASAPEVGTYNDNYGWGLGIEQMGVKPDVEVDNNPKSAYDGEDAQLVRAIEVLKDWMQEEPVVFPKDPGPRKDMSRKGDTC